MSESRWLKEPLGERIREGRLARGFTTQQLADAAKVSRQSINYYENNGKTPSPDILRRIAHTLEFPEPFFLKVFDTPVQTTPIYFRSLKASEKMCREKYKTKLVWMQREVDFLSKYLQLPNENILNPHDSDFEQIGIDDIEQIASNLRRYWGIGKKPISNLVRLVESKGIPISRMKFGNTEIDASSVVFKDRAYIMLSDDKTSCARSRFDIAHELGHLILHKNVAFEEYSNPKQFRKLENQAHAFAGAFLMPRETFGVEVISDSIDHFVDLKRRWKTSIAAIIMRVEGLGLFPEHRIRGMWIERGRRNWVKTEPLDNELPIEKPAILKEAIELLKNEGGIPAEDNINYLGISNVDFEELCNIRLSANDDIPKPDLRLLQ